MSRFQATFGRLHAEHEGGLFPYLTAGFPSVPTSQALADVALAAGADGFEIGVPFSDPLADGATLQRVNTQALQAGASLDTALDLARYIRARSPQTPVVLMSYYNPVLHRGLDAAARLLSDAAADGLIVPDLPPEEAASLHSALDTQTLALIPMLAPTSSDARIARVVEGASGFVYCVALTGVTGARQDVSANVGDLLIRARRGTPLPLVVGFGISQPEHVQRMCALGADGVIVASALADIVERAADPAGEAYTYLAGLKAATKPATVV